MRFLQIGSDGSIKEQGYSLSLGSSSSSAKWAGKDDVLYSIDYQRGIDILRGGEHYVPGAPPESGHIPGTNGETPPLRPTPRRRRSAPRSRSARGGRVVAGALLLAAQRI